MSREQDPLTPEERALADALAGAAPRRGPSPQMDAAILAQARAAVATRAAPAARRPRRRWPAAFGVAASLMLAVGVAWQLRPLPEQELPAATESAPAAARYGQPPAEAASEPDAAAAQSAPEPATAEPEPVPRAPEPAPAPETTSPDTAARQLPPAAPLPAPAAPAQQAQRAETVSSALEGVRSTPQPPPEETAIGHGRVRQQADALPSLAPPLDESAAAAPPAAARATVADDDGGIVFDREQLHDLPPATADSPGIHRAWLERIRELRDAGEIDAARESLREFRRRHPDHPLPDDLDGLLDE